MVTKKLATSVSMAALLLLSANAFAVDSDTTSSTTTTSTTAPSTTPTTTPGMTTTDTAGTTTSSTTTTNTVTVGAETSKSMKGVGVFTRATGDKCDPSCEGTFAANDKSENALLFLKDERNAFMIVPYTSQDSTTMKQLMAQKNMLKGTWKQKDDGTIEFRSFGKAKK